MNIFTMKIYNAIDVPYESVGDLLAWIVGILTTFIGAILVYMRSQIKERSTEYKSEIKELRSQLNNELEYNKEQDKENVKLLTDTGSILSNSVKKLENNSDILRDNSEVLRNIKDIQVQIDVKIKEIKTHNNEQ